MEVLLSCLLGQAPEGRPGFFEFLRAVGEEGAEALIVSGKNMCILFSFY